jgi:diacylglycerol O-acyltransferase / wax synthase
MQRMNGIDPMFIYSDTPETPMEVAYACVFDPTTVDGGYSFTRVRNRLTERLPLVPPFRRRLVTVPLGLDHPRWVDDPDFDLDNHLFRVALPAPGGESEYARAVAEVLEHPLPQDQPPWEMHVIEGLEGGLVGLIAKVHHSVIDGVAGAELLARFLDMTPEGGDDLPGAGEDAWDPAPLPSFARIVSDALPHVASSPMRMLRATREMGGTAVRLFRRAVDSATGPVSIPGGAPATFETQVGPRREVAFAELDLAEVRALKDRFGATINDVVLAVCSGALRHYLIAHGEDSDSPLVAVIPVSVRAEEAPGTEDREGGEDGVGAAATVGPPPNLGNRLSAMFVPLANDKKTPLERLRTVIAASASCKGQERAAGFGTAASMLADAIPPAVARPVIQLGMRAGLVRRLRAGNLMISNVPGPDFPLYFAGMRLQNLYPLGPVVDGVALNITVQSYLGSLFVGINASASAVPDPPGLAGEMAEELSLLTKMAANVAGRRGHRRQVQSADTGTSAGTSAAPAMTRRDPGTSTTPAL